MGACFIFPFASALRDALLFTELARLRDDGSLLLARLRWNLTVEAQEAGLCCGAKDYRRAPRISRPSWC